MEPVLLRRLSLTALAQPRSLLPFIRFRSSRAWQTPSKKSERENEENHKAFATIMDQSLQRMQHTLAHKVPQVKFPDLSKLPVDIESIRAITPGDLVWTGHSVELVLYMPQTWNDQLLTVNMRGIIGEMAWAQIKGRLGRGVPAKLLKVPLGKLAVDTVTTSEIEHSQSLQQSKTFGHVVGRPTASWIYRLAAPHLRAYQNQIETYARKLKPSVVSKIKTHYQCDNAVILPFCDFVGSVTGNNSALDSCAVQLCLEDEQLQFDIQKSVSYLSTDTLLIRSFQDAQELAKAQYSSRVSQQYLENYANGNITSGISQSRAIEELRVQFSNVGYIDPQETSELLKIGDGGMWSRLGYQWIFNLAATNRLNPKKLLPDQMAELRQDFDEPVYCIDSKESKLMEDGVSIARQDDKTIRVGIHISNPSAFMDLGPEFVHNMPLGGTVLERDMVWRMLPPDFTKQLSLDKRNRPSLSVFAKIDLETGESSDISVRALRLKNIKNIRVENINLGQAPFDLLWNVAKWRLNLRFQRGAFLLNPYADQEPDLPLLYPRLNSSHAIVEEFMLLGNELIARYCCENKIPIFYRTRELLLASKALENEFNVDRTSNKGFVGAHWRKIITSGRLTIEPSSFPGIGTTLNTRFTSPLRRLEDLLVHVQLQAHLLQQAGLPANTISFTEEQLLSIQSRLQVMEYYIQMLARDISYLKTFKRAAVSPGMKFTGVVVKDVAETPNSSIYLPEFQLYADYKDDKVLPIELKKEFTVTRVLEYGRSVHVV